MGDDVLETALYSRENLLNGEDIARLVVDVHHRQQYRILVAGIYKVLGTEASVLARRDADYLKALALKVCEGLVHRGVLDCRSDDFPALFAVCGSGSAEGEVVALGGSGGENHVVGSGSEGISYRPAGFVHCELSVKSRTVQGGRIAEVVSHGFERGGDCLGAGLCRRGIIKIYHRFTTFYIQ